MPCGFFTLPTCSNNSGSNENETLNSTMRCEGKCEIEIIEQHETIEQHEEHVAFHFFVTCPARLSQRAWKHAHINLSIFSPSYKKLGPETCSHQTVLAWRTLLPRAWCPLLPRAWCPLSRRDSESSNCLNW